MMRFLPCVIGIMLCILRINENRIITKPVKESECPTNLCDRKKRPMEQKQPKMTGEQDVNLFVKFISLFIVNIFLE